MRDPLVSIPLLLLDFGAAALLIVGLPHLLSTKPPDVSRLADPTPLPGEDDPS